MLKDYKDLKVWQISYQLCLEIYKITRRYPVHEKYGLVLQMRRAALSIPSNIAEGYSRKQLGEYIRFLHITYGSLAELETQVFLSRDLKYLDQEEFQLLYDKIREIERMLFALIDSLNSKLETSKP